eukprot:360049-Chlamydomonas_euryale.AAC.5
MSGGQATGTADTLSAPQQVKFSFSPVIGQAHAPLQSCMPSTSGNTPIHLLQPFTFGSPAFPAPTDARGAPEHSGAYILLPNSVGSASQHIFQPGDLLHMPFISLVSPGLQYQVGWKNQTHQHACAVRY